MTDLATLTSLAPIKTHANHELGSRITSLDYSDNGLWLLSTGTDENLNLYDCRTGEFAKTIPSKKYGCHLGRFTHRSTNCVFASTKGDDAIRYLSLHDNKFVRYFRGHKNKVISLELSPVDDTLLSSALDRTVRLWDLRSPNPEGVIQMPTPGNHITFDAMGLIFAVVSQEKRTVALYDVRNFEREPFLQFSCHNVPGNLQKVELSNNSKYLVVSGDGVSHGIYDAMNGNPLGRITGHEPLKRSSVSPTAFSVDGDYLVGGSDLQRVCVWDVRDAQKNDHASIYTPVQETKCSITPTVVSFDPKLMLLATADESLQMWVRQ